MEDRVPWAERSKVRGEILKGLWLPLGHTLALPWLAHIEANHLGGELFHGEAAQQGPMSPDNGQ